MGKLLTCRTVTISPSFKTLTSIRRRTSTMASTITNRSTIRYNINPFISLYFTCITVVSKVTNFTLTFILCHTCTLPVTFIYIDT